RRHTRFSRDWSSAVCSSDLPYRVGCSVVVSSLVTPGRGRDPVGPQEPRDDFADRVVDRPFVLLALTPGVDPLDVALVPCDVGDRSEARRVGTEGTSRGKPVT